LLRWSRWNLTRGGQYACFFFFYRCWSLALSIPYSFFTFFPFCFFSMRKIEWRPARRSLRFFPLFLAYLGIAFSPFSTSLNGKTVCLIYFLPTSNPFPFFVEEDMSPLSFFCWVFLDSHFFPQSPCCSMKVFSPPPFKRTFFLFMVKRMSRPSLPLPLHPVTPLPFPLPHPKKKTLEGLCLPASISPFVLVFFQIASLPLFQQVKQVALCSPNLLCSVPFLPPAVNIPFFFLISSSNSPAFFPSMAVRTR